MLGKQVLRVIPPGAGSEVAAELVRLEQSRLDGTASDEDLARLEALPADLADAVEREAVVLVLATATRRGGFRRARLLQASIDWLEAQGYAEAKWADVPAEVRESALVLQQAASVAGALADDECVNFQPPDDAEGWLEVPDYLFAPALAAAWELNPHWAPQVPLESEKNVRAPGSANS